MGICISSASSEIPQDGHGNVIHFVDNGIRKQLGGSVYSTQGSKGLNQDAAILYQDFGADGGAFCGVFDGHGKSGHVVSEMVRNRLPCLLVSQKNVVANAAEEEEGERSENQIEETESCGDLVQWKEALISAFKVMDKEIKLQENLDCTCSGTTAVVILRQGEDLVIANLGDSRAVLGTITESGLQAVQLTTDLKPGLSSEAARIEKCKGRVTALKEEPHIKRVWLPHDDMPGLAMSRSFGDFLLKDYGIIAIPEVSHYHLTSNDRFVVLATDGVWDVLSNEEVASIAWEARSTEEAARAVVEAARGAWKRKFPCSKIDDCTVICLFLLNEAGR